MNILIKLTCLIGLVIAPILGGHSYEESHEINANTIESQSIPNEVIEKEIMVKMDANDDGTAKAVVTTTMTENGKETSTEQVFEGTEAEVKTQIKALKDVDIKIEKN
jgi:K(+)-stimulated pyrophosphate-energized sodium pump